MSRSGRVDVRVVPWVVLGTVVVAVILGCLGVLMEDPTTGVDPPRWQHIFLACLGLDVAVLIGALWILFTREHRTLLSCIASALGTSLKGPGSPDAGLFAAVIYGTWAWLRQKPKIQSPPATPSE